MRHPDLAGPADPRRGARFTRAFLPTAALLLACGTTALAAPGLSRLAFSSMREGGDFHIYLMNPDGSGIQRVTQGTYGGDGAAISPEGARIVFESPRNGWANLYVINTDGTNEHRLLGSSFYGQSGTWSTDGNQIAFTHSSNNGLPNGTGSTWVVNSNGTGLHQLSPAGADDWQPSWSPDGSRIAFGSFVGGRSDIFVMNADGSGRTQITTGPGDKFGPRWSPDGSALAYTWCPGGGSYAVGCIHVVRPDGSRDTAITDTTWFNGRPAWSPSGARISFQSNRSGCFQICSMTTDGSDLQRLTWVASTPGDFNGDWRVVTLPAGVGDAPATASLALSVTNPARATAAVHFRLPRDAEVRLDVLECTGRLVRGLLRQRASAGAHHASWDGRDERGRLCLSGVYDCLLTAGGEVRSARVVLIR